MTFYALNEPAWELPEPDRWNKSRVLVYSEADILAEYWDYWCHQMQQALERGSPNVSPDNFSHTNCIEDWCSLHWAWMLGSTPEPD